MRYFQFFTVVVVLICFNLKCALSQNNKHGTKPNIILIVADDLGWKDVGFMGSKFYNTPNLDALASQSLVFSNAYTAAANCAPSRACLLSGLNTPRHGIYTVGTSERGEKETRKLIPIKNINVLADSIITLAETLQKAGYTTINIGKWHLGDDPKTQGFDINIAGSHHGHTPSYFSPYKNEALKDGKDGEYLTDRLTSEAISFIEKPGEKPFFLYLPYFAVHTPLQAPDSLKEKYIGKAAINGQGHATYAAMVESLDSNIGRIMKKLNELNLSENTIIIFTSDNGGIRTISDQGPLRAGKGSYYEGGIRVPLIVRWSGKIASGEKSDVPVSNLDFYPTIMDLLAIDRRNMQLDGTSILPVFKGESLATRPLYWHFPIYLQAYDPKSDQGRDSVFRTRPGAAIRMGDWKLHEYYEDGVVELYNLKEDIGERTNLASKNPEITKKLHAQLRNWQKQVKAPIPVKLNPEFNPALQFVLKKSKPNSED